LLKGTVIKYEDATAPVADDAWEKASTSFNREY
jgi:hypothetical protein